MALDATGRLCEPARVLIDQRGSEVVPLPECLRLLAEAAKQGAIGRLAVSQEQAPLVRPANFTYSDRCILVRLGPGIICDAAAGALVAFPKWTGWTAKVGSHGASWSAVWRRSRAPSPSSRHVKRTRPLRSCPSLARHFSRSGSMS